MNTVRKIFASALVLATIVSVSGINFAKAASMDGDLIKMNGLSTVYYYKGGKRYVFPQQNTYMSWYTDFNGVKTISQSELESYPLGANVTMRPGTYLVKITTNPTVYAVEPGAKLRSIVSEANASSLFGANWAKKVVDVSDAFFTNYTITTPLTAGVYPAGSLVKGTSADVYYFDGTNFRKFASEAAFYANKFNFNFVQTAPAAMTMTPMGTEITGLESGLTDLTMGASGIVGGSGLSVALSSDTPASANVPKGANRVTFTKFNVTAANDGDVRLDTVIVNRGGVGSASDVENVYLYDGMTRLTTARSINSSTNAATFTNVNYTVPKGTTKTLSIVGDVSGSATSGNNYFGITAASGIATNGATVTGSFPINGNTMSITNVTNGSITIARSGSLTSPKAGEIGAKIAVFTLTAGSSEDLKVHAVNLYNIGNISADKLSNFSLKQSGNVMATASSQSSGGNIVLNFTTPYLIEKGNVRTFELYADVAASARANDTIRIYLDNSSDLYALGQTYGFGATVTRTDYDNSANSGADASWSAVEAGQVTLAFQGPSVADYSTQQQDVELFRFTITSQSNIEIRNTRLALTAGGTDSDDDNSDEGGLYKNTSANYSDIKFVDVTSSALVAGPKDLPTYAGGYDTSVTQTYTDTWTVNAGQTRTIKVTADIGSFTPASNETIKATLNTFSGSSDIKNLDTNSYVSTSDIVPSSNMAGNTHRVKAGTVTLTLGGTPSAQTYIHGSTGVFMTGINIAAGSGKDVKITSMKLTSTGADDCATETDCVLNVKLWDGTTQVGTTKSLASDSTVTFNNLNLSVPKGTTKNILVTVDLNTITFTAGADTLDMSIASADDVSAQDVDGNTVGVSGTVDGPDHTISASGTLSVALGPDDAETEARIILMGKTDETIGRFKFTAVNEPLKLTKVTIELPANTADDINSLSLWNGSTKVTNDVTVTNAGTPYAEFSVFTTDFIVPKDGNATLTVKANTNTISGGADSGTAIVATLATDTTDDDQFEARGVSSSTVLDDDDITQTDARSMTLRKTKMTLTQNALGTSSIVNSADQKVYEFTVAADSAEDVAIKQLILDVTLNDNVGTNDTLTAGSFKIFRGSTNITSLVDIHNVAGATIEDTNSLAEGTSQAIITWASEEIIAKGTSNTYSIWATPTGFSTPADDDYMIVKLKADSTAQTSTHVYLVDLDTTAAQQTASLGLQDASAVTGTEGATPTLAANMNIIWSDNSDIPHDYDLVDSSLAGTDSTSGDDWMNGYLLKNLPFSGSTLTN